MSKPTARNLITTEDGSHSIFDTALDETYHSTHGAVQESEHVYINAGLKHYFELYGKRQAINIFELGFGTGLNAWLACRFAGVQNQKINYIGIEAFPLEEKEYAGLNYPEILPFDQGRQQFFNIQQTPWDQAVQISDRFSLKKCTGKFEDLVPEEEAFDLVFYDAFAPSKQPGIWSPCHLAKAWKMLKNPGILITYCAQGQFRRDLKQQGFEVEKLPGPPGKMEITRAVKTI